MGNEYYVDIDVKDLYDSLSSIDQITFADEILSEFDHEDSYDLVRDIALTYNESMTEDLIKELFDSLGFDTQHSIYEYIKEIIDDSTI